MQLYPAQHSGCFGPLRASRHHATSCKELAQNTVSSHVTAMLANLNCKKTGAISDSLVLIRASVSDHRRSLPDRMDQCDASYPIKLGRTTMGSHQKGALERPTPQ